MLKKNRMIAAAIALGISTSFINSVTMINVYAENRIIADAGSYKIGFDLDKSGEAVDKYGDTWAYSELDDGTLLVRGTRNVKSNIEFPDYLNGKPVTVIEGIDCWDRTFSIQSKVQSVKVPSTVKAIANSAFSFCTNLTDIQIPSSVTYIGAISFGDTPWAKAHRDAQGFVIVNNILLSAKNQSGEVVIPSNVREIGEYAFDSQKNMTGVTIPKTLAEVDESAFHACANLKKVKVLDKNTHVGTFAFADCYNLTSVGLPDGGKVEENAFQSTPYQDTPEDENGFKILNGTLINGSNALGNFKIPDGVKSIGDMAFYGNKAITNVELSDSITSIGESAFENSVNLKNVTLNEGLKSIKENAFNNCPLSVTIQIPDSVSELSKDAFSNGTSIEKGGKVSVINRTENILSIPTTPSSPSNSPTPTPSNSSTKPTVKQGWHKDGDYWYWLWSNGTKRTGWYEENGNWYYFYGNGQMATEFIDLGGGCKYYLNPNQDAYEGAMKTGWQKINGYWYYFNPQADGYKGVMKKGWLYNGGNWYYLYSDGRMAHNTVIDGYYVNSSGAWVK